MPQPRDFVLALGALILAVLAIDVIVTAIFPRIGRVLKYVLFAVAVWVIGGLWLGLSAGILVVVYVLLVVVLYFLTRRF